MVGKMKRLRPKLHRDAVKLPGPSTEPPGLSALEAPSSGGAAEAQSDVLFPSRIFAGTTISPRCLVQTLKLEPCPPGTTAGSKEPEERKSSKKCKMKERRERWLHTMDSIIRTKERQRAAAVRRATPVVGDLRPLADALPELSQLIGPSTAPAGRRRNRKAIPVKRATPTDFSRMNPAHKLRLLETERSRFSDSVKLLSSTQNPLLDVGEQLRKRMRQEEEQQPG